LKKHLRQPTFRYWPFILKGFVYRFERQLFGNADLPWRSSGNGPLEKPKPKELPQI
jgi:hypothetical protein